MMPKKHNMRTFKNIIGIFRLLAKFNIWYIVILLIFSIVLSLLPIYTLILTQELVNLLQSGSSGIDYLYRIIFLFIFIKLIILVITNLNSYLFTRYNDYLILKLNVLFQEYCSLLRFKDFENSTIYDMLHRAEQEIGVRPISLIKNLLSLISSIISFICSMIILVNWEKWTIIGFVLLPILAFNHYKRINDLEFNTIYNRANENRKSWYISHLLIKDKFVKEVKLYGLSNYLINQFYLIKNSIFKQNLDLNKKRSNFNFLYQLVNFAYSTIIFIYAISQTLNNSIMVGNFITFINLTNKLETSISSITSSYFLVFSDSLYCKNILDFFQFIDNNTSTPTNGLALSEISRVELRNLSFKYPNSKNYCLKNINYTFELGKIYTLVGENGSGKSTLIKLISGLYDEFEGDVLVNGISLKKFDSMAYQRKISVVSQDYINYEFNVGMNIGLDKFDENDYSNVKRAAEQSGADQFINKLKNGYLQQLGNWFDNGVQLSGGQWQKLAISRGLYREADMYIFDEPTASLDPSSEFAFLQNFLDKFKNKIALFVTHRFTNAKLSDEILVLKDGSLIESGTHFELMRNNNEYCKLYKIQLGEEYSKDE